MKAGEIETKDFCHRVWAGRWISVYFVSADKKKR
jgi:hypothetical protein